MELLEKTEKKRFMQKLSPLVKSLNAKTGRIRFERARNLTEQFDANPQEHVMEEKK